MVNATSQKSEQQSSDMPAQADHEVITTEAVVDMTDDDTQALEADIKHIAATAYETLRLQLPYLKTELLTSIVSKAENLLRTEIEASQFEIAASKSRSSFLVLSPELRNRVYELVIKPKAQFISHMYCRVGTDRPDKLLPPAICRTSSQVRAETLPIWYGINPFAAHIGSKRDPPPRRITRWLQQLKPGTAQMIRDLHVLVREKHPSCQSAACLESNKNVPDCDDCNEGYTNELGIVEAGVPEKAIKVKRGNFVSKQSLCAAARLRKGMDIAEFGILLGRKDLI